MLLIYSDPTAWGTLTPDEAAVVTKEFMEYTTAINDSNEIVNGDRLQGVDTATTVRTQDGERLVTDGPFAETREVLGGFYTIDVADLDRALKLAGELPSVKRGLGSVEVRPIHEM
jgi:hypothetical protein